MGLRARSGVRAAGKTTTLQMLVGRVQPSAGGAIVRGGRSRLGFCPQQDALLELLTGAEQLALYARLKGVPERAVAGQVADVLARVSLPAEVTPDLSRSCRAAGFRVWELEAAILKCEAMESPEFSALAFGVESAFLALM